MQGFIAKIDTGRNGVTSTVPTLTDSNIRGIEMANENPTLPFSFFPLHPLAHDLAGQRFGRLLVLGYAGNQKWLCRCDCGRISCPARGNLQSGQSTSCGCETAGRLRKSVTSHGKSTTRVYRLWASMIQRCRHDNPRYRHHAGRGIRVCERWATSFVNFLEDMGEPPTKKHSLDRIDNDGNYEPSNCRWATQREQCNNLRKNRTLLINGERVTVAELSRRTGIAYACLIKRYTSLWCPDCIVLPSTGKSQFTCEHKVADVMRRRHPEFDTTNYANNAEHFKREA